MRVLLDRELTAVKPVLDYFRCAADGVATFEIAQGAKSKSGFFRLGPEATCYGRPTGATKPTADGPLADASKDVRRLGAAVVLPFDVDEAASNLRYERYAASAQSNRWVERSWTKEIYYLLRPALPTSIRRHLQKAYLRGWDSIAFPNWPVDRSVDVMFEKLLLLIMQAEQVHRLPFIWFWPKGSKACAIVTHDVETTLGRDFSPRLMDIDDSFGVPASFQIVPEKRYSLSESYLQEFRARGFEINIQGLDHDGNLFADRDLFLKAAEKINRYGKEFGACGFRSPILYRNVDWFQDLNFSYDMSIPNVARLEAQRGGCCTVMPYFLPGGMLELPLTTTEDYSLFNILNDYSTKLWKQQIDAILKGSGLMTFLVHPDYVTTEPAQKVFKALLEEVARLREDENVWVALPGEVDCWWRERSEMSLVSDGSHWSVEGPGSENARVAYACLDGDRITYEIEQ